MLDEVLHLFPSRYVHIGVTKPSRMNGPHRPASRRERGNWASATPTPCKPISLKKSAGICPRKGRRAVGWDEICSLAWSRRGRDVVARAHPLRTRPAIRGNDTVLAPDPLLYLDHRQSSLATEPPGEFRFFP